MAPAFQRTRRRPRTDVDDHAAAPGQHRGDPGTQAVVDALHVDIDDTIPCVGVGLGETRDRLDQAGIVDQDVEPAMPLHGGPHGGFDIAEGGHVAFDGRGLAALATDAFGECRDRPRRAGGKHRRRPRSRQSQCRRGADPTTCASHQRHLSR
jgi:hypothetical protein